MSIQSHLLGTSVLAVGLVAGVASPVTRAHAAVVCAITGTTGTPDLGCSSEDGDEALPSSGSVGSSVGSAYASGENSAILRVQPGSWRMFASRVFCCGQGSGRLFDLVSVLAVNPYKYVTEPSGDTRRYVLSVSSRS